MPIRFISLNEEFIEKIKKEGYDGRLMNIKNYKPEEGRKTYYVSPANSLCSMTGGIDYVLSRIIFPQIKTEIKKKLSTVGYVSKKGRHYLPIGSSLIIDQEENRSLILSPTMLLPQVIRGTNNVYYATMAILFNILVNRGESLEDVDILFTSMGCGYGKMRVKDSIRQIKKAIRDYPSYEAVIHDDSTILHQPNLNEQHPYKQNVEFMDISISTSTDFD